MSLAFYGLYRDCICIVFYVIKIIAVLCFMLPGGHGDYNCVIFLVTRGGGAWRL